MSAIKPLRAPLATVKACIRCKSGKAIGRKRYCESCRIQNSKEHSRQWVASRHDIVFLRRRVEVLEALVQEMNTKLCGCKVARVSGKQL